MQKFFHQIKTNKILVISLAIFIIFSGTVKVFAVVSAPPSTGGYAPGYTLDPGCSPGDSVYDCIVKGGWLLTGNAGTVDGTDFIGTTDNIPLNFRVNNQKAGRIDNTLHNTFFGYQAGNVDTSEDNTALGYQALYSNVTGSQSVAIGSGALYSNTGTGKSVAVGYKALYSNTNGNDNVAVGAEALYTNVSGVYNVASGYRALYLNEGGIGNVASGGETLYNNTVGDYNIALGYWTLYSNTEGDRNIAIGDYALLANTLGLDNIAIGSNSLQNNATASRNIAIGERALYGLSYDPSVAWNSDNVAVGYRALYSTDSTDGTNSIQNTAIGNFALYSNTTGSLNLAEGYQTLYSNTTGSNNVALGANAGYKSGTTGAYANNIFIGYQAANNITTGADNNIIIGYDIDLPTAGGDGQLSIGNLIFGTDLSDTGTTVDTNALVGIGTATPGYRLDVQIDSASSYVAKFFNDGNNSNRYGILIQAGQDDEAGGDENIFVQLRDGNGTDVGSLCAQNGTVGLCQASDIRLKENISDTEIGLDNLMNIKVRDFSLIQDENHHIVHGFIAQELYDAYPDAVIKPSDPNKTWKVMTTQLTPVIIKSIQEINLKLNVINDFAQLDKPNTWRDSLIAWFANATNRITRIFTGEICLTDPGKETVCLNRTELKALKSLINIPSLSTTTTFESITTPEPEPAITQEIIPETAPEPIPEPVSEEITEPVAEPPVPEIIFEPVSEQTPEPEQEIISEPTPEPVPEPTLDSVPKM